MAANLLNAQRSLLEGRPEWALHYLANALELAPKGSKQWSKIMLAIRFTRKAVEQLHAS